jgi:hypothetical protein
MHADDLIARARDAMGTPTLYFLGAGGFYADEMPPPHPAEQASVQAMLDRLDAVKRRRYEDEARAAGIDLGALPEVAPFCDCSGYVCWALGLPRAPTRGARHGWVWTHSIYEDALRGGGMFDRIEAGAVALVCRPGALLVYPSPGDGQPGHIGIVSETDAAGRPLQVLHCSSLNQRLPGGGEINAIAQTDASVFEARLGAVRPTLAVWWRGLRG